MGRPIARTEVIIGPKKKQEKKRKRIRGFDHTSRFQKGTLLSSVSCGLTRFHTTRLNL